MKIILFGAGDFGHRVSKYLKQVDESPICFVDNNSTLWGQCFDGIKVCSPEEINEIKYDFVAICVNDQYYDDVYFQLRVEFRVDENRIIHWTYWARKELLQYYDSSVVDLSEDEEKIIKRIESSDRLKAFNYDFVDNYFNKAGCFWDADCNMYYALYKSHRLYLGSKFKVKEHAQIYINSLLMEQDVRSPHRYLSEEFPFDGGCVIDAGAAEGNFSLDIIERADHVIMIEADPAWNDAIKKTFEPWKDKITIINKYLSDKDTDKTITIDKLSETYDFDFIKMDIEGAEVSAVRGGIKYLKRKNKIKLALCTYHNNDDEEKLRALLEPIGFRCQTTDGFMVFPDNLMQPARLVHGVLRAEK